MTRALVEKLDEDQVSATVAAQLLLAAALPLCQVYTRADKKQQASSVLTHAVALIPFLPLPTAAALLRLAHNTFEGEQSASGTPAEYDSRILGAALEATCNATDVLRKIQTTSGIRKSSAPVSPATRPQRSFQKSPVVSLVVDVPPGASAAETASPKDGASTTPDGITTPKRRNAFECSRDCGSVLLMLLVYSPQFVRMASNGDSHSGSP